MKIFFDTEFIENGKTIELLSIGAIREDGKKFYAEAKETDRSFASTWVAENVIPYLSGPIVSKNEIKINFLRFCGEAPEFWGYYADYDWVVLCQLFGSMIDLPKGWPMYCRDLKQEIDNRGNPKVPIPQFRIHNAINDAIWNKDVHNWLFGATLLPCEVK